MKVLILEGTGFVGRNLLALLGQAGIDCSSCSRSEGGDRRDPASARNRRQLIST